MKKLLLIATIIFSALVANAQQTEDDVYVGKSRTYGNYSGTDVANTKPMKDQLIIRGTVIKVDWCEEDCQTVWVRKDDGSKVSIGTKDYGFTVPKNIVGKRIIIQGIDPAKYPAEKKSPKKQYQKHVQVAAIGVRIFY